jgi:hypothetical protein
MPGAANYRVPTAITAAAKASTLWKTTPGKARRLSDVPAFTERHGSTLNATSKHFTAFRCNVIVMLNQRVVAIPGSEKSVR